MSRKTFALVYQCGIANLFDVTGAKRQDDSVRVFQGDFRGAELIARGASLAGATVAVFHADVAGDCLSATWHGGRGDMFADAKAVQS